MKLALLLTIVWLLPALVFVVSVCAAAQREPTAADLTLRWQLDHGGLT